MEKLYFNIFVELFKLYRIEPKDFVPLFQRGTIFKRVRTACRNAATAELMDVSGLYIRQKVSCSTCSSLFGVLDVKSDTLRACRK